MYAPIAYNGVNVGLDLKISPPQQWSAPKTTGARCPLPARIDSLPFVFVSSLNSIWIAQGRAVVTNDF
jgi:hypothetical protein